MVMAAGLGIMAQYYNDTELGSLVATRVEATIDQNWATGVPVAGLNADQFSARYSGQIEANSTGLHNFNLTAEVGARLWINGQRLIDRWTDTSITGATAPIELVAGRRYDIQLELRETTGPASVQLQWSSASMPLQAIATGNLFASERGNIERRVWNSVAGSNVASLTTLSSYPNQPSTSTLLSALETTSSGQDQFGQLLVGMLYPPKTGSYRFYIAADDSAELWLSNSSSPLGKQRIAQVTSATGARDWLATPGQQSAPVILVAGQGYALEVIHKDNAGSDHVAVGWKIPGSSTINVVDGQFLTPLRPQSVCSRNSLMLSKATRRPLSLQSHARDRSPTP